MVEVGAWRQGSAVGWEVVDRGPRLLLSKALAGWRWHCDAWWVVVSGGRWLVGEAMTRLGDLSGSAVERNFSSPGKNPTVEFCRGLAGEDRKAGSVQRAARSVQLTRPEIRRGGPLVVTGSSYTALGMECCQLGRPGREGPRQTGGCISRALGAVARRERRETRRPGLTTSTSGKTREYAATREWRGRREEGAIKFAEACFQGAKFWLVIPHLVVYEYSCLPFACDLYTTRLLGRHLHTM